MKKFFAKGFYGVALTMLVASCVQDDIVKTIDENGTADVSFSLDINDLSSKAIAENGYDDETCPEYEDLQKLADENNLKVSFTVKSKKTDDDGETYVRDLTSVLDEMIADPIALPLDDEITIDNFLVYTEEGEGETKTTKALYSAINKESEFADFLNEDETFPHIFTIDPSEKLQKIKKPVTVACAVNRTPEDFGFKLWNMSFKHYFNIPFVVDACDNDGLPVVAKGRLMTYQTKDQLDNEGKLVRTELFGDGETSHLWVAEDINKPDNEEWYRFELYLENNGAESSRPLEGRMNIADLKQYTQHPAWIDDFGVMDFDVCNSQDDATDDGREPFIFPKHTAGTYMVEDLWPSDGLKVDYDYNDMVMDYDNYFNYVNKDKSAGLQYFTTYITVKAHGASYKNAFALRFEGLKDVKDNVKYTVVRWIDKKDGQGLVRQTTPGNIAPLNLSTNELYCTDKGVYILPIVDDIATKFKGASGAPFVNVKRDEALKEGYTYKYMITFNTPVEGNVQIMPMAFTQINNTDNNFAREINIVGMEPASTSTTSEYQALCTWWQEPYHLYYAGSLQNPEDNRPWILDIPKSGLQWMYETDDISKKYPKFMDWSTSGYLNDKDWYKVIDPAY